MITKLDKGCAGLFLPKGSCLLDIIMHAYLTIFADGFKVLSQFDLLNAAVLIKKSSLVYLFMISINSSDTASSSVTSH